LTGGTAGAVRSELIRRGVRRIVEEALEAEVEDRLGRRYSGRGDEQARGYRNGYRRGILKSAEGPIEYATPQVSDLGEPYRAAVRERLAGRTEELEFPARRGLDRSPRPSPAGSGERRNGFVFVSHTDDVRP